MKIRDGLTVFYTNADNLLNKIDELKVRLQLKTFDALVVTEVYPKTGKSDDIQLSELHIDGYNIYRSNVESHSRGVIIYVSEQISSNIIVDLTNHPFSESVWVEIRWNKTDNLLLGIWEEYTGAPNQTVKITISYLKSLVLRLAKTLRIL